MSNFKCNKCNNVLAEIGIPPQIQMLQRVNNVMNTGEQVSEEIKNDPFVYKGLYCPSCNKAFCPPCAKMQSQICPGCGQVGLMPAYRPLLNKRTVALASGTEENGHKETTTNAKTSNTDVAVTGGAIGGAIAGALIVWGGGQYMSWGTIAVFLFTMMGVDKDKKWLAGIVFASVAGLMVGILKQMHF